MLFAKHIMHTINYVMHTCLLYDMVMIHVSLAHDMIYCNAHESHVVEIIYTYKLVMRAIASLWFPEMWTMTRREAEGHRSRRGKP